MTPLFLSFLFPPFLPFLVLPAFLGLHPDNPPPVKLIPNVPAHHDGEPEKPQPTLPGHHTSLNCPDCSRRQRVVREISSPVFGGRPRPRFSGCFIITPDSSWEPLSPYELTSMIFETGSVASCGFCEGFCEVSVTLFFPFWSTGPIQTVSPCRLTMYPLPSTMQTCPSGDHLTGSELLSPISSHSPFFTRPDPMPSVWYYILSVSPHVKYHLLSSPLCTTGIL